MNIPGGSVVKNAPAIQETWETWVQSLGWEDPLEQEMAARSSTLAWRIPKDRGESDTTEHAHGHTTFYLSTHPLMKTMGCFYLLAIVKSTETLADKYLLGFCCSVAK